MYVQIQGDNHFSLILTFILLSVQTQWPVVLTTTAGETKKPGKQFLLLLLFLMFEYDNMKMIIIYYLIIFCIDNLYLKSN